MKKKNIQFIVLASFFTLLIVSLLYYFLQNMYVDEQDGKVLGFMDRFKIDRSDHIENDIRRYQAQIMNRPKIDLKISSDVEGASGIKKFEILSQASNYRNDPNRLYYAWSSPKISGENVLSETWWGVDNNNLLNPYALHSALINGEYQFYSPTGEKLYYTADDAPSEDMIGRRKYPYGQKFATFQDFCKYYFNTNAGEGECTPDGDPDGDGMMWVCGGDDAGTITYNNDDVINWLKGVEGMLDPIVSVTAGGQALDANGDPKLCYKKQEKLCGGRYMRTCRSVACEGEAMPSGESSDIFTNPVSCSSSMDCPLRNDTGETYTTDISCSQSVPCNECILTNRDREDNSCTYTCPVGCEVASMHWPCDYCTADPDKDDDTTGLEPYFPTEDNPAIAEFRSPSSGSSATTKVYLKGTIRFPLLQGTVSQDASLENQFRVRFPTTVTGEDDCYGIFTFDEEDQLWTFTTTESWCEEAAQGVANMLNDNPTQVRQSVDLEGAWLEIPFPDEGSSIGRIYIKGPGLPEHEGGRRREREFEEKSALHADQTEEEKLTLNGEPLTIARGRDYLIVKNSRGEIIHATAWGNTRVRTDPNSTGRNDLIVERQYGVGPLGFRMIVNRFNVGTGAQVPFNYTVHSYICPDGDCLGGAVTPGAITNFENPGYHTILANQQYQLVSWVDDLAPPGTTIYAEVGLPKKQHCVSAQEAYLWGVGDANDLLNNPETGINRISIQDRSEPLTPPKDLNISYLKYHMFPNAYGELPALKSVSEGGCGAPWLPVTGGAEKQFTNCEEFFFGSDPREASGFSSLKNQAGITGSQGNIPDEARAMGLGQTELAINFPKDYQLSWLDDDGDGKFTIGVRAEGLDMNYFIIASHNFDGLEKPPLAFLSGDEVNVAPSIIPAVTNLSDKEARLIFTPTNPAVGEVIRVFPEIEGFEFAKGNLFYRWNLKRMSDESEVLDTEAENPSPVLREWKRGKSELSFTALDPEGYIASVDISEKEDPMPDEMLSATVEIPIGGQGIGSIQFECIQYPGTQDNPVLPIAQDALCPNRASKVRASITSAGTENDRFDWYLDDTLADSGDGMTSFDFQVTKEYPDTHEVMVKVYNIENSENEPYEAEPAEIQVKDSRLALKIDDEIVTDNGGSISLSPGNYTVEALPWGYEDFQASQNLYEWEVEQNPSEPNPWRDSGKGKNSITVNLAENESKEIDIDFKANYNEMEDSYFGEPLSFSYNILSGSSVLSFMNPLKNIGNFLLASPYSLLPPIGKKVVNSIAALGMFAFILIAVRHFTGKEH